MRVLVVSHTYVPVNARGKIRELSRFADLTLLVPARWTFDLFSAMAELEPHGKPALMRSPVFLAGHNIRYMYSPSAVWRALCQLQPEVVLVEEEPCSLALAQFSLLQKRFGFRLCFFAWENVLWQPRLTKWIEQFNLAIAIGAVTGSQGAAQVLRHKGFRKTIAVIPQMGVNTDQFYPPNVSLPTSPFVIGYAGRLVEEKGLRTLGDALAKLRGEWELHLIGDGPLRPELQKFAEQAGWSERIRWIGFVSRDELPDYLRGMHTLLLPSQSTPHWQEQFGRVLIEAMACGTAVIGSSSGAIPEVIGDAGLIFPEGDAAALRERIYQLMRDPALRDHLSARGLQRVRTHYTDSVIAQNLSVFLRAVLC